VYAFEALLTETSSYSGKCDGCGATGVPIMKLSLGRDFFGRVYDRLSPNADMSPKWYCDACSVEKNLQRDFRDIQMEFGKLRKGDSSALNETEQLHRATLRLKEITVLIAAAVRIPACILYFHRSTAKAQYGQPRKLSCMLSRLCSLKPRHIAANATAAAPQGCPL